MTECLNAQTYLEVLLLRVKNTYATGIWRILDVQGIGASPSWFTGSLMSIHVKIRRSSFFHTKGPWLGPSSLHIATLASYTDDI